MLDRNELMRFLAWLFGMPEQRIAIPVKEEADIPARGRKPQQY